MDVKKLWIKILVTTAVILLAMSSMAFGYISQKSESNIQVWTSPAADSQES